ncbi:hypothetical protein N0V93_009452 [Gnomoniopsis smithogilvyi]|uniref:Uncharacterized protein n=1 Tax=Gnomoniopsis smithogilvyi TaxID=1191159 RepID=A0A9W8YJN6_9PEZI|nr:hypothetical protein N0V93_009452 [Gnomoniopsis smithogilvyi]
MMVTSADGGAALASLANVMFITSAQDLHGLINHNELSPRAVTDIGKQVDFTTFLEWLALVRDTVVANPVS